MPFGPKREGHADATVCSTEALVLTRTSTATARPGKTAGASSALDAAGHPSRRCGPSEETAGGRQGA